MKVSLLRVFFKDVIDFLIIGILTSCLTFLVYSLNPYFARVDLSFYFIEQWLELFFKNPNLIIVLIIFGAIVSLCYFILSTLIFKSTLGSLVCGLRMVDQNENPIGFKKALLLGIGSFLGVMLFLISPFYAWWLDDDHKGLSEKLAKVFFIKN